MGTSPMNFLPLTHSTTQAPGYSIGNNVTLASVQLLVPRFMDVALMACTVAWSYAQPSATRIEEHRNLEWNEPGSCVVEFARTPFRTIHWHEVALENRSWGLHDVNVTRWDGADAVDRNGSESHTVSRTLQKYWFWPAESYRG